MANASAYVLKVTAGPDYSEANQKIVHVNESTPLHISSSAISANLNVRIRDYRGLPHGSPSTSPYFEHAPHTSDRFSIGFTFTLNEDAHGDELVFGNDFDHPIRDRLPWGFSTAFNFIKSWVDPGLEGDPYADEPWLYGSLLSSINVLNVGEKEGKADAEKEVVVEEGAKGDGEELRKSAGMPDASNARMKWALNNEHRHAFTFQKGRVYGCDFFNPYLDFNDFSLKLPVITIPIMKHWDGQPLRSHIFRYVLKNKTKNEPLMVVMFTLIPVSSLDENGNEKPEGETAPKQTSEADTTVENDDVD